MSQPRDSKGRFVSTKEKVYTRGYKAFNKGLVCRNKQYAENTVFKEPYAKICESGMHFCENPAAIMNYYAFLDKNAAPCEYAEVESLAKPITEDDKSCTTKLKIGKKLPFAEYIRLVADSLIAKGRKVKLFRHVSAGPEEESVQQCGIQAQVGARSFQIQLGADCRQAQAGITSSQLQCNVRSMQAQVESFGTQAQTNYNCIQAQTGSNSVQSQLGDVCLQIQAGDRSAQSQYGNCCRQASVGVDSKSSAYGEHSLVAALGPYSKAKGAVGCMLVLAEYDYDFSCCGYSPKAVVSAVVDGVKIKADTWYTARDGKLVEWEIGRV